MFASILLYVCAWRLVVYGIMYVLIYVYIYLCICSTTLLLIACIIDFHGPLTRYVKLRVAHAPGMPGTFSPPPTSKETAS